MFEEENGRVCGGKYVVCARWSPGQGIRGYTTRSCIEITELERGRIRCDNSLERAAKGEENLQGKAGERRA